MMKTSFSILKRYPILNCKFFSANSDKEFFLSLVKHKTETEQKKAPIDYLKMLKISKSIDKPNEEIRKKKPNDYDDWETTEQNIVEMERNTFSNKTDKFRDNLFEETIESGNNKWGDLSKLKRIDNINQSESNELRKRSFRTNRICPAGMRGTYGGVDMGINETRSSADRFITNIDSNKEEIVKKLSNHPIDESQLIAHNVDVVEKIDTEENDLEETIDDNASIESLHQQIEKIDLDEIKTLPEKIFNVAPIIDKNKTLTNLFKYGVDINSFEDRKGGANILLRLDWDTGVVPVISFFKEQANFTDKQLAVIFSKFPRIFKTPLIEIQSVFDYFKSRNLTGDNIASIINRKPLILSNQKDLIEKKLIELEKTLDLPSENINEMVVFEPRILLENILKMKYCIAQLTKTLGFTEKEMKLITISNPKVLITRAEDMAQNFIFLHRGLNISYEEMVKNADALSSSPTLLKNRVKYLIYLKRYQPDPTEELFTPLSNILNPDEKVFCENVAHSTVSQFRKFLKTM